jgi:hypothetical protein
LMNLSLTIFYLLESRVEFFPALTYHRIDLTGLTLERRVDWLTSRGFERSESSAM